MQGHVLLQATRQKIHLITCEAEEGVWGLTEEDCVPRTHVRAVEEGRQRAGNNSGGEKNEWRYLKYAKWRLKEGI